MQISPKRYEINIASENVFVLFFNQTFLCRFNFIFCFNCTLNAKLSLKKNTYIARYALSTVLTNTEIHKYSVVSRALGNSEGLVQQSDEILMFTVLLEVCKRYVKYKIKLR